MKALRIIGAVVGVLIVILIIVITMQPSQAHIEKSVVINAPESTIFPYVSDYQKFNLWSPWVKMDPEAKQTFEGTPGTVGHKMSWVGQKTGSGSQWIEEVEENQHLKGGLKFGDYDAKYTTEFHLEQQGGGTKVTWSYDGPNEGLSGKAMWLIMGAVLSSQYTDGLTDLKTLVESGSVH